MSVKSSVKSYYEDELTFLMYLVNNTFLQNWNIFHEYMNVDNMIMDYTIISCSEVACAIPVCYSIDAHCLLLMVQQAELKF